MTIAQFYTFSSSTSTISYTCSSTDWYHAQPSSEKPKKTKVVKEEVETQEEEKPEQLFHFDVDNLNI